MRMSDLIVKKRDGQALTTEEIRYMIDGYKGRDFLYGKGVCKRRNP